MCSHGASSPSPQEERLGPLWRSFVIAVVTDPGSDLGCTARAWNQQCAAHGPPSPVIPNHVSACSQLN